MADENESSVHKGSSQVVQKSLEITNFNWFITDMKEKLNTTLKSPLFLLKSDPFVKMNIIFGKEKEMYLLNALDSSQSDLYYIGVEFHIDDLEYKLSVPHVMKFSVGKQNYCLVSKSFVPNTEKDYCEQYIPDFISESDLLYCLSDGCLEIRLKITPIARTEIELYEKCLTKLKTSFEVFLNSKILSDVVFCIDKCEFPAHKVILASASPVFARMFSTEMKENITNKVEVKGFHPNVFNEMLRYIYAGKIKNLKSVALDLFRLADMYDIDGLKMSCEDYLQRNLSDENVIDILEIADSLNSATLKAECISYVDKNFENVKKTDSFRNIKRDLLFGLFCATRAC